MRSRTLVLGAIAVCLNVTGQNLSIGLIGGGSLTDAARDTTILYPDSEGSRIWSQSKDWVLGVSAEFRIRSRFSVEVEGAYRELHATWATVLSDGTLNSVSPSPVVTWQFPVLAKYRFGSRRWRPFIEGGPAFRTTGNLNFYPSHYGGAGGAGVEAGWRGLSFAPTVRYTRWARESEGGRTGHLQPNQLEFLLGISRASESNWNPVGPRVSLGAVAGWGLTADYQDRHFGVTTIVAVPQPGGGYTYNQVKGTEYIAGVTSLSAGPSIEVHFNERLSVEVDALHKPLRSTTWTITDGGAKSRPWTGTEGVTWQLPVLAKYRFRVKRVTPFVEAGPSFRLPEWSLSTRGWTAGAGMQMHWHALNVGPALRYTHWGADRGMSGVSGNELSLLVGCSFGGPRLL